MSPRPLVRNGGDPEQVRRAERKVQQANEILAGSLRAVLATPAGRYLLAALLERSHIWKSSFDLSGSHMYFNEGERNIGLYWRALAIEADPDGYSLMEREQEARVKQLDQETAVAHDAPPAIAEE